MSVRIHQLSKEIGMDNKELIELLRDRGFEVKSASSTIDNISAESLVEEFTKEESPAAEAPEATAEAEAAPAGPKIPEGAIVKTAEDLQREREAREQEEAREKAEKAAAAAAAKAPPPAPKAPPVATPPRPSTPPTAGRPPSPSGPPRPPVAPRPSQPPVAPKPSQPPVAGKPPAPAGPPKAATPPVVAPAPTAGKPAAPAAGKPPAPAGPPKPPAGPPKPPSASMPPSVPKPPAPEAAEESAEDEAAEPAEKKILHAKPPIVVRDFAGQIGLKPFKLISELMEMGIFASMNQTIEETVATKLAERHGFVLEIHHRGEGSDKPAAKKKEEKPAEDDPRFLKPRPPVCCILGHVDHGKTTLLDTIRKANVAGDEAGGITQHIGAYQIDHNGNKISFVDTPGHAAFSMMRSRGANVTDIAILVVAADDGFMPQTDEALRFAKAANNAIVVAINKIDAKGANVDRVKQQMQEKGIAPEDWGGETICVEISALKGTNIDELLDMILLQAEVLELKANPSCAASGTIVESQIEQGRGSTATVIVEKGTLKKGDALLCGEAYCKVKSMLDDAGNVLRDAPPATPVKIMGWSTTPKSGAKFSTEKNEKMAKRAAEEATLDRKREAALQAKEDSQKAPATTVEDLFAAIENQQKKCLRVIVKSDVHGSAEALVNSLEAIESDKVDLDVISYGVGNITKNDITLASAGGSCIVGFNVKLDNGVQSLAKHHNVRIIQHEIIYELLDQVEEEMAGLLEAEMSERKLGAAEVRQVFGVGKGRNVAGCMVTEGTINRGRKARVLRDGELIHESTIDTLRRFKDDVKEVRAGYECGINVDGYDDYEEGDIIECFDVEAIRPSLR
ncbi:translation initiation factor IF-2 [Coraliomargarita parva]|uniref:translation initiation factor IF-2 n=1 Tax=Coraliomargarita parva TaxID=3014050 RepID=UPI0022B5C42C|nr:translation initiation factor IF-2 [Coraliomargarita parva]